MSNFQIAKIEALQKAIDNTGVSNSKICSVGGCSRDTLKKALKGKRIMRAKANAIINGINENLPNGHRDNNLADLFDNEEPPTEEPPV